MDRSIAASEAVTSSNTKSPARARSFRLWCAALILGGCESAITYAAMVGLNWALLGLGTTLTILVCSWRADDLGFEQRWVPAVLATLLSVALTLTADPFWQFPVAAALVATLGVQILGLLGTRTESLGAVRLAFAPFRSGVGIVQECAHRTRELLAQLRADACVPVIRAVALALPVTLVLGLVLSGADPTFAAWRDYIANVLLQISILPRLCWFAALSALTLGGLGLAIQPRPAIAEKRSRDSFGLRFSRTDQVTVLGSAAAVFAAYLALQVSYLFGNPGAVVGSHTTYADTVHRGFAELNAAVTLSALVIVTLLGRSSVQPLPGLSKAMAITLLLESQILAMSALHRVNLYEAAYGYTEQRLLVAIYASATIAAQALLGWEIIGAADFRRLLRRTCALGILTLCGLVIWNTEAWIVRANIARYRSTGQLDYDYLIRDLGPDGLPELTRRLPGLHTSLRGEVEKCLRFVGARQIAPTIRYQWFEWTARRAALREVIEQYPFSGSDCGSRAIPTP